jgi:O-antigen ligase
VAGIVVIALLHVAYGLAAFAKVHSRLGGLYFTAVPGQAAVCLWAMAWVAPKTKWRLLAFALLAPLLIHQFFSFTRGYWLGVIAAFAMSIVLSWREIASGGFARVARSVGILAGAVAATVLLLVLSVSVLGGGDVLGAAGSRFGSSFSKETSTETASNVMRLNEYSLAIDAGRQSPVFGRGYGFSYIFVDPFRNIRSPDRVVHNYYLFLWLKLGLVGVAVFFFFVWRLFRMTLGALRHEQDWMARAWLIAAAAVMVQMLVISMTNYSLADFNAASMSAFIWGMAMMVTLTRRQAAIS